MAALTVNDGKSSEISIVLCGEAGQGIQTVEHFLTRVFKAAGFHLAASKEYQSRIRGGSNSTEIRLASGRVAAFVDRVDLFLPLSRGAVDWLRRRITAGTTTLADRSALGAELDGLPGPVLDIPLAAMAKEAGGAIYATTVAAGAVAGIFGVAPELLDGYLRKRFAAKGPSVVEANLGAARRGYAFGEGLRCRGTVCPAIRTDDAVRDAVLLSGGEAVGLGAVAGGCNFIASYPMSPSTPVLTFLAERAEEFGIVVEQAEDEIAAINMGLGAWYAGARAMVTTSGGGFALMTEGLSLAGMHESPMVIHLGQRPGPATGLPTRTEQADLELALHAGHGEFPRIIFAPGGLEQAFELTRRAFDLADRFQVPVFILTDQHLIDACAETPTFVWPDAPPRSHVERTGADYRRYRVTENGVSPRGIPGLGEGVVVAGSDEHDEEGHITESADVRRAMVDKRLRKRALLAGEIVAPAVFSAGTPRDRYEALVVGWGSTLHPVREAMAALGRDDIGFLHFSQVYPLAADVAAPLERARCVIFIEQNATGQFARLFKAETGWRPSATGGERHILKYDGSPFSVEEVADRLGEALR